MANKKILTVGLRLAGNDSESHPFRSDISLLDWDIILFKPDISDFLDYSQTFQGKPCLSDDRSFQLKERSEHWRREIKTAIDTGKLVVVYLIELCEIHIATGEKRTSGTGRNQQTTRIVTDFNNYHCIPFDTKPVKTKGQEIKLASKNSELISSYWQEFSSQSTYKVLLNGDVEPCLVTKNGDKTVGTIIRSKNSGGALILLPDVDFCPDEFFNDDDESDEVWTIEAKQFAARYIKSIVSLYKSIHSAGEVTPEPEWAKSQVYKLNDEKSAAEELLKIESRLEAVQAEKELIIQRVKELSRLRNLLFEKGKPLEYAILDALKIMGFKVSQYDDGESEFDAIFESEEGRLIGEVEGKDNKAINIDKLRQLALNVYEDLGREEVNTPAKAVLFGNAFRLVPIRERIEPFTTKCVSAASTSSTALVFTPDLFIVAKYLLDNSDNAFAIECRKALLSSVGRVEFPSIPKIKTNSANLDEIEA